MGYDERIRNVFPFHDAIRDAIDAALRVLLPNRAERLIADVNWPDVESGMNERMKAILFVTDERIEDLLVRAKVHQVQQFFKVFVLGGWVAFKQ